MERRIALLDGARRVEAITAWWSEGGGRDSSGLAVVWVVRDSNGRRRLWGAFVDHHGSPSCPSTLELPSRCRGGRTAWRGAPWHFERRSQGLEGPHSEFSIDGKGDPHDHLACRRRVRGGPTILATRVVR